MAINNKEGALYWATGIDNTGLQKGKDQSIGILRGLSRQVSGMDVFAGLGVSAALIFARMTKDAYAFSKEFQTAMKEVETISKATQDNYEGMSDAIVKLSKEVPDSAIELSKAYYQIVSAGYDGAKGLEVLAAASKGAVAGVTSTLIAADGLTTVMNAWKMRTEEVHSVNDVMFKTVERGKVTYDQLAASFAQVAPLAAASNISFEEISASIATITKQGTPAAQAFTQVRSAIIAMNEQFGKGWSKTMSLQEGFELMAETAEKTGVQLQELTGRVEGSMAVLATTGKNAASAAEDIESIGTAAGAADKAFIIMSKSAEVQLKILGNNLKSRMKEYGDWLVKNAGEFAGTINSMFSTTADKFKDMKLNVDSLERNIKPLITRLDQLKSKTKLNSDEQRELDGLILSISRSIPTAITSFDEYGKALDINSGKAKAFIEQQRRLQEYMNRKAIEENEKTLKALEKQIDYFQTKLNTGTTRTSVAAFGVTMEEVLSTKQIIKYQDKLLELQAEAGQTKLLINDLKGIIEEPLDKGTGGGEIDKIVPPPIDLTKFEDDLKEAKRAYDEYLMLVKNGFKKEADLFYSTQLDLGGSYKSYLKNQLELYKDDFEARKILLLEYSAIVEQEREDSKKAEEELFEASIKRIEAFNQFLTSTNVQASDRLKPSGTKGITDDMARKLTETFTTLNKVQSKSEKTQRIWDNILSDLTDPYNWSVATDSFSDIANITGQISQEVGNVMNSMAGMASGIINVLGGNYIQGSIGLFGSLVSLFESIGSEGSTIFADNLQRINRLLEEQQRIIEASERKGGQEEIMQRQLATEKEKLKVTKEQYESYLLFIEQFKKDSSNLPKDLRARMLENMLKNAEDFLNQVKDAQYEVDQLNQQITDLGAGFVTEIDLADKIADAFESGKTSARDFADYANEIMNDAALQVFKASVLGPAITEAQEYLSEALKDGALTDEEASTFRNMLAEAGEGARAIYEGLFGSLPEGGAKEDKNSLSGSIRASLTEETGSILAGSINAIRIDNREMLIAQLSMLDHLSAIEVNTGNLSAIRQDLSDIKASFQNIAI